MNAKLNITSNRKPNILWVFGDQHRAHAVSYRGDPNVYTPNIDNMAREGMRFDCAVSGAPWCTPFRGALISGMYPHQSGVTGNGHALSPEIPTVATAFNDAGYHTAYVGKWHLDGTNDRDHYVPPDHRGDFNYWMANEACNSQHDSYIFGSDSEEPQRLPGYETDALTNVMINHLKTHITDSDNYQPFFGVLSVQPPHGPNVTPTNPSYESSRITAANIRLRRNVPLVKSIQDKARLDLSGYYSMIENLDYNLGRLRQALTSLDVDRETYIFFFSDHGDMMGSHGQFGKSSPWEESIRIPFIIHRAGGAYNMQTGITDVPINHVDIAPTSLGLCGITTPDSMVGFNYSEHCILKNPSRITTTNHLLEDPATAFLQQIPSKLMNNTVHKPWRAVVTTDGWKYACTPNNDWLLFNTIEDPFEQANHIFNIKYQPEKERCQKLLSEWITTTGDQFQLPDISLP